MKKLLTTVVTLLTIAVAAAQTVQGQYVVHGKSFRSDSAPDDSVFLLDGHPEGNVISATTLSADSTFTFSGTVDEPFLAAVRIGEFGSGTVLFIESGQITMHIDVPTSGAPAESTTILGGTPLNDAVQKTGDKMQPVMAKASELMALMFSDMPEKEKEKKGMEIKSGIEQEVKQILLEAYDQNKDNIFGADVLCELHRTEVITDEQLKQMVCEAGAALTKYPKLRTLLETL